MHAHRIVSPTEKSTTRASMCTSVIRGSSKAVFAFNKRMKPAASAIPKMPPSEEKTSASVRICCITRLRPAPRAVRIENSRTRPAAPQYAVHFMQPWKERIVREVGYGLLLEGAPASDPVKSMQVKSEPVARKGESA